MAPLSNATYGKGDTMDSQENAKDPQNQPVPADHGADTANVQAAEKDPAQVTGDQPVSNERIESAQPGEAPGISHNDSPGGTPQIDGELGPAAPQLHPELHQQGSGEE